METIRCLLFVGIVSSSAFAPLPVFAEGKFHCELTKDGKKTDIKDAKNRKQCNEKGGKWVKDHGHDHGGGEGDHDHEEGEKKEEKKEETK